MDENKTPFEISEVGEEGKKKTEKTQEMGEEVKEKAAEIVEKIKELVKEGNITRIRIRKDDLIILNLPMTVGVVGALLGVAAAPWAVILATIGTIGLSCTVEVEDKDGKVTVIHGKV